MIHKIMRRSLQDTNPRKMRKIGTRRESGIETEIEIKTKRGTRTGIGTESVIAIGIGTGNGVREGSEAGM